MTCPICKAVQYCPCPMCSIRRPEGGKTFLRGYGDNIRCWKCGHEGTEREWIEADLDGVEQERRARIYLNKRIRKLRRVK